MTTTSVLYLFDIDGTLLRAHGAGARSLDAVFAARWGVTGAMRGIDAGGRTDPWLVDQVFVQRLGRHATAAEIDELLAAYVPALARELEASATLRVLPHVPDVLDDLARRDDVHLGLATGNIEAGARVKLGAAGLLDRFAFGGYGCDSADRAALVARAIERGEARAGAPCPRERVVVVGDTVHDIAAARACGVRVVAVATGWTSLETLEAAGADAVMPDLSTLPDWHAATLA
jgi:phosphoglycolate phosphatase-like HAD superfamily hydrolase